MTDPSPRSAGKGSGIRQRVDWARYYRNRAKIDMRKKRKPERKRRVR